jgi:hypothetical protein
MTPCPTCRSQLTTITVHALACTGQGCSCAGRDEVCVACLQARGPGEGGARPHFSGMTAGLAWNGTAERAKRGHRSRALSWDRKGGEL